MSGIKEFFKEATGDKHYGAAVLSLSLMMMFFLATAGLSMFDNGFIITLAVISCIAGIISIVFFFWALACLFESIT